MKNTLKLVLFTVIILLSFNIKMNAEVLETCEYEIPNNGGIIQAESNDYTNLSITFDYDEIWNKVLFIINGKNASYSTSRYLISSSDELVELPNPYGSIKYVHADGIYSKKMPENFVCPELYAKTADVPDPKTSGQNGFNMVQGLVLSTEYEYNSFKINQKGSGSNSSSSTELTCNFYGYLDDNKIKSAVKFSYSFNSFYLQDNEFLLDDDIYKVKLDKKTFEMSSATYNQLKNEIGRALAYGNVCPEIKISIKKMSKNNYQVSGLTTDDSEKGVFTSDVDEIQEMIGDYDKGLIADVDISDEKGTCVDYLGDASIKGTTAYLLDKIFTIIKIVSILILIIFSMLDFAQTISSDKDNLLEKVKTFSKRLIILIIILLLPSIIDMIGNLIGVDNILCGIK